MFRRRRSSEPDDDALDLDDLDAEPEVAGQPAAPARPEGPWDAGDAPDDGVERIDLGGLLVPVAGGHELRVDIDQASGQVTSVTLAVSTSAMQVGAYAAPRSAGIWAEVRAELADAVTVGGGSAQEAAGPYGTELRANVPTDVPGQLAPARFVGVDGPRWFLRAMVQGQAAVEPDADAVLFEVFRQIVVQRGVDAMVVRDPLPLVLPVDLSEAAADAAAAATESEQPDLSLPERGPEITETR